MSIKKFWRQMFLLRGNHPRWHLPFWFIYILFDRVYWGSKKPKGFFPHGSSFKVYDRYTDIPRQSYVFTEKTKQCNFDLKFCPYIGPLILRISWKFQPKRMFLSRDIDFSSDFSFCDPLLARDYFLKNQYLEKGTFFLGETFRIF